MDVQHVHPVSLGAIYDYLASAPRRERIRLKFYFGAWADESYEASHQAAERILQVQSYRNAIPLTRDVIQARPLSQLGAASKMLRTAFELWRERSGSFTSEPFGALENAGLLEDALVFQREQATGKLVYRRVGRSSLMTQIYGEAWAERSVGRYHAHDPSHQQSANPLCDSYEEVMRRSQPRFDHIRTFVDDENTEPFWLSYGRLLLPCEGANGDGALLALCDIKEEASIPFMAARVA